MKRLLGIVLVCVSLSEAVWAQGQSRTGTSSWRRNTAIVLFSGIGGSILGLSTLSFYGQPQEHTGNITTGALLGLLGGVGYIVYENSPKTTAPRNRYDYYGLFQPTERVQPAKVASVPTVQFEFTF